MASSGNFGDSPWGGFPWGGPLTQSVPTGTVPPISYALNQWNTIYEEIAIILNETGGLRLGLLTDQQLFMLAGEVLLDFCSITGLIKKIFNEVLSFGVGTYSYSSQIGEIESAVGQEHYLHSTSDYFLSNSNSTWGTDIGSCEVYRQDQINPEQIQVYPAPPYDGCQVIIAAGQGGYGVISTISAGTTSVQVSNPAYGTIAAAVDGNMYVEAENPGYGVVANLVPSEGNLELFATTIPYNVTDIVRQTYIELVPTDFTPYLKYGILEKIFSSDSELKSESKAKYCRIRYLEGISILNALMCRYE